MEAEEGSSNGDNGEGVGLDWRLGSQDGDNGGRILGGNGVLGFKMSKYYEDFFYCIK